MLLVRVPACAPQNYSNQAPRPMEKARNMALLALLTCTYLVAGRDLNPRPLGYEPYDVRLRPPGLSLAVALTSVNG